MTLSRLHPGHLVLAALLLAAAVLGWRAVAVATAPLPPTPAFAPPALADRGLLARFDPFFPALADAGDRLAVTALPFSLHGVRADSATGRGSAIIATGDGQQQVFSVGDTLAEGVTLAAIAADHVVLDRSGTREALWLDSGSTEAVQRFDPSQPAAPSASGFVSSPPSSPESAPPDQPDAIDQAPPPGVVVQGRTIPADSGEPDKGGGE